MTAPWNPESGKYSKSMEAYVRWYQEKRTPAARPLEDDEMAKARLVNAYLLGCDPEFLILDDVGRVVNVGGIVPKDGAVGYDHAGNVVELRPAPAKGTFMLVKRMKELMDREPHMVKLAGYRWRAGAITKAPMAHPDARVGKDGNATFTLGGHVHIDQPPLEGEEVFHGMIRAMDALTKTLEGLDILPQEGSRLRRNDPVAKRNKYGQFGDWRHAKNPDGRMRSEYRTMASWLYHPHTAYLCLTGAKLCATNPAIAEEMLRGVPSFERLQGFFEVFRHKDTNAQRALEKMFDGRNLKFLQHDPDVNFRDTWREMGL